VTLQSLSYFVALLAIWLLAYPVRNPRHRQLLLLAASYLFYATWGLGFLAILIASSMMNYAWGRLLRHRCTVGCLWTGVALNLSLLALFKYLAPLTGEFSPGSVLDHFMRRIAMPVGISFWTFQALSFLFDVYREEEVDPSLVEFCLYLAFWPTVLSGPVCRLPEMLPHLRAVSAPTWDDVSTGTHRLVIGLFMKLVLAKLLVAGAASMDGGEGVDYGFDQIMAGWGGLDVWFLAIGFGFQLFFDFAGYSHIAIGTARLFGIRLAENFDHPYLSTTPSIFWTRWHMSLSFWIRDYVFLPLAVVRREIWWRNLALAGSMILFGIWHGATAPFILWGAYHGILLVAHRQVQGIRKRWKINLPTRIDSLVSWIVTFLAVCLGWIFFRAHSVHQAALMFRAILSAGSYTHLALRPDFYIITALVVLAYFVCCSIEAGLRRVQEDSPIARLIWLGSPLVYAVSLILIVIFSGQESLFVYFQF
jgi:alginate O-acetyltransferase complex protein AlgI